MTGRGGRGWRLLAPRTEAYPRLLAQVTDPPAIRVRGQLEPDWPMVAVVGARLSTPYGEDVAYDLAMGLAQAGMVVVSGLARGIDACAHRGALDGGGATIAVMGSGPDTIYPPEHAELADRIAAQGALVTQFEEGIAPIASNFPRRNQVLSGLCIGVVVVEARRRSGAMSTAGAAGAQGRAVMAVPGSVHSQASRGCHDLVRDGARLVTSLAEVLEEVRAETSVAALAPAAVGTADAPPVFGDVRDDVLRVLRSRAMTLEEICARLRLAPSDAAVALAELRLDAHVVLREGLYSAVRRRKPRSSPAARE